MAKVCSPSLADAERRRDSVLRALLAIAAWVATAFAAGIGPIAARAADGSLPPAPALPDLVRTKHQVFSIPFSPPPSQSPDTAAQRITLSVSKDLGATWEAAGEAAPNAGSFSFSAGSDGEYWFRLRAIDAKGRMRGGAGPDLRVLVDAAGPRIAARVWKGADGEIICRYAAVDDSLRLDSLSFEYRGKGDQGWKKVAAVGMLSRESPAHMVGEEIWWAGEQVETMTVRIAISDSSGNNTVRQFTLNPTDPQVDQAALARELGAPPLPSPEAVGFEPPRAAAMPSAHRPTPATAATPAQAGGWNAEPASPWATDSPTSSGQSVLVRPVGTGGAVFPPAAGGGALDALALPGGAGLAGTSADRGLAVPTAQQPLEYRGKPLQLVRSRRFAWDYDYEVDAADIGAVRVELWSTRDGGITWQRTAVDDDTKSPIAVSLPATGLYGFRLEVVSNQPNAAGGPTSGDAPDSWVGVDDETPELELIEVSRAKPGEPMGVVIRWTARDQMLVPRSTRLSYSPNASGPWATIAESLESQGEHRWQPPRGVPAKVYIRAEAADAAGNIGETVTPQAVAVAVPRVTGKLGGVRPLTP